MNATIPLPDAAALLVAAVLAGLFTVAAAGLRPRRERRRQP